jgi:predicted lipoprotein with Yx(FWY)xxD motif
VTAPAPAETAGAPDPATGESSVQVADNQELGQILVTADGMTLYTFAIDEPGVSNCTTNACVTFWPPATVEAQPSAGPGVPGTLSTLTRSDGSMQLTYNGSPLYTFALDKNPGDAKGEGVNEFGGVWNAVPVAGAS